MYDRKSQQLRDNKCFVMLMLMLHNIIYSIIIKFTHVRTRTKIYGFLYYDVKHTFRDSAKNPINFQHSGKEIQNLEVKFWER